MKITKSKLRKIITEELAHVMGEAPMDPTMVGGKDVSYNHLANILGIVVSPRMKQDAEPNIPYLMYVIGVAKEKVQKAKEAIKGNKNDQGAIDTIRNAIGMYMETVVEVQKHFEMVPNTYAKFLEANNLGNAVSSFNHIAKVLGEMKAEAEKVLTLAKKSNAYGNAAVWMTRTYSAGQGEGLVFFQTGQGNVKTVNPEIMMKETGMTRHIEGLKQLIAKTAKGAAEQPAAEQPAAEAP
jgi:hypothetical protein